jgi:hypothetical protein
MSRVVLEDHMCRVISLIIFSCVLTSASITSAAPIFRWRDASGGVHFSNRPAAIPEGATEVVLPPIIVAPAPTGVVSPVAPVAARVPTSTRAECPPADASGVVDAVATRLAGTRHLDELTLFVGGIPVASDPDSRITVKGADPNGRATASVEQAAIAYPGGSRCPLRPPLERYAVSGGRRGAPARLCDDYRRAFAEVGVAVNRNQGVARSFHAVAERFVTVARHGHTAGGGRVLALQPGALTTVSYVPEERVPLPPWTVEAHIAQTDELGAESADLVEELTVALEEIDAAAQRAGCW